MARKQNLLVFNPKTINTGNKQKIHTTTSNANNGNFIFEVNHGLKIEPSLRNFNNDKEGETS